MAQWSRPFTRTGIVSILESLAEEGRIPAVADGDNYDRHFVVEPPREERHGQVSTNAAMVLCKGYAMQPRVLAALLVEKLQAIDTVTQVDIAGPGFINLSLNDSLWHDELRRILREGIRYGDGYKRGDAPVVVEYVSANPTGPLHAGHARGAVVGDVLASLLEKAGYEVVREYWINDSGAQVDILARSLYLRYKEALGYPIGSIPEGLYPGDYLIAPAQALAERDGDKWLHEDESAWCVPLRRYAVDYMMTVIRADLAALGIRMDVFTSEQDIVDNAKVEEAFAILEQAGLIYTGTLPPPKGNKGNKAKGNKGGATDDWEPRPQTLFRATDFGDDVDRPLKKSDGSWTYFATDVAYHADKIHRGFETMINVWGADHGGYVKRMQAAVKALGAGNSTLDVKICRMVNMTDNGKQVKMSKRAGSFITAREVVEQVGRDVLRFIMLTRRNDAPLDFDFARVREQSRDNPVFYVQYAHARACSVMRHATELWGADAVSDDALAAVPLQRLNAPEVMVLLRLLSTWPRLIESVAETHEPHRVAYFLQEAAAAFHGLWNIGKENAQLRFILEDDRELSLAHLALVRATAVVIASGLSVMGITPSETM